MILEEKRKGRGYQITGSFDLAETPADMLEFLMRNKKYVKMDDGIVTIVAPKSRIKWNKKN